MIVEIDISGVFHMSNRDGRRAKKNRKHNFSSPNKRCPICGNTLDKCGDHGEGHRHHRFCKTCKYSNF